MPMMCAVVFSPRGRLYYADPGPYSPRVGDRVLVGTDAGPEVAQCMWAPRWVSDEVGGLPVLVGMADDEDIARDAASRRRRAEARVAAKRLIREHGLPMKVVGVDHLGRDKAFTIYFSADGRVDFRALVRDLARTLSARIELRQLSARDSAKVMGGIGSCGRDLCCATFLTDFEPVSMRMAKDQDLPLNPMKISGACGRLMCCLRYEHPLYEQFKATAPPVGARVTTPRGSGRVAGHDVRRDQVTVTLDDGGGQCSCGRADVCGSRKAYDAAHPSAKPTSAEPVDATPPTRPAAPSEAAPPTRPAAPSEAAPPTRPAPPSEAAPPTRPAPPSEAPSTRAALAGASPAEAALADPAGAEERPAADGGSAFGAPPPRSSRRIRRRLGPSSRSGDEVGRGEADG